MKSQNLDEASMNPMYPLALITHMGGIITKLEEIEQVRKGTFYKCEIVIEGESFECIAFFTKGGDRIIVDVKDYHSDWDEFIDDPQLAFIKRVEMLGLQNNNFHFFIFKALGFFKVILYLLSIAIFCVAFYKMVFVNALSISLMDIFSGIICFITALWTNHYQLYGKNFK